MNKKTIEAAAKEYAIRVCNGEFPITYTKEHVINHTAADYKAGFNAHKQYVLEMLKENAKCAAILTDEDKARNAQDILIETYNDLILIVSNEAGAEWLSSQSQWIDVKDRLPEMIEGENYSKNVCAVCDGFLKVMAYCLIIDVVENFHAWCNCYGDIDGDPLHDDNYNVNFWQPLPTLP